MAAEPAPTVLEARTPLGASMLWGLQRAYYERAGPQAWRPGAIPLHITTSPTMAQAYARLVRAFIADRREPASGPLTVIELGGGSGRFAFRLLRRLRGLDVRYVLTDIVEANLEHARTSERLVPFVESGVLDTAIFDAARPGPLALQVSAATIDGPLPGPVVLVANYVFDCIPHDAFSVVGGELLETLLTVLSPRPDLDLSLPGSLEQLRFAWDHRPLDPTRAADGAVLELARHYASSLQDTSVLVPTAALRCLEHVAALAPAGLLALVSDRGHVSEAAISEQTDSGLAVHEQSVSLPVNFDAIARWVRGRGGVAMLTPHRPKRLVTAAFAIGAGALPETERVYDQEVARRGPDDVFTLYTVLLRHPSDLTLQEILAILRALEWDVDVLELLVPAIVERVGGEPEHVRRELHLAVALAWEDFYPCGDEAQIAARLAMVLAALGVTDGAQRLLAIAAGGEAR